MGIGYYVIIGVVALISLFAQMYVKSNYSKYKEIATYRNMTGAQVARYILDNNGLQDVEIVQSSGGELSDHYDPTKKIVALSPENYHNASIAAVSVSAHEVGHAIQHATGYKFIALRNKLLGPAIIASKFSQIAIVIGIASRVTNLLDIGIIMIGVIALFQIVTLPVEFDASARALKIIKSENLVDDSEYSGAKSMLTSAALTYVAAVLGTLINLLYFIVLRNRRND